MKVATGLPSQTGRQQKQGLCKSVEASNCTQGGQHPGYHYIRDNSISRDNEKNIGVPAVRTQEQCISFHGNLLKTL